MDERKLPWTQRVVGYSNKNVREIEDVKTNTVLRFDFDFPEEKAKFIVTACNEHDTLKAKIQTLELDLKFARGTSQQRMDVAQELITENQNLKHALSKYQELK